MNSRTQHLYSIQSTRAANYNNLSTFSKHSDSTYWVNTVILRSYSSITSSESYIQIQARKYVGRFHPFIGHEGPWGEYRHSSTLFLTTALEGGEGSASYPCRTLPPGNTRYPFYRRLGGPEGRSGQVRKISPHQDSIPAPSTP